MSPRRDINEANIVRQGLASMGLEDGATEGQVPAIRADGEVEFVTPAADGGSQPALKSGLYSAVTFAVDDSTTVNLSWGASVQDGDDVLDLSDPLNPLIVEEGVYAFTLVVSALVAAPGYAGKKATIGLSADPDNFDVFVWGQVPLDYFADFGASGGQLAMTCFCPAGSLVVANLVHDVGAPTNFRQETVVQQLRS